MKRKKHRQSRAAQMRSGHLPEQKENQNRVDHVKEDVDRMRGGCARPEELGVQHQRKPRERMPVASVTRGERPMDVRQREAAVDVRITEEIFVIIEIHEAVMPDGRINNDRCQGQKQANGDRAGTRPMLAGGLNIHTLIKANESAGCEQNVSSILWRDTEGLQSGAYLRVSRLEL